MKKRIRESKGRLKKWREKVIEEIKKLVLSEIFAIYFSFAERFFHSLSLFSRFTKKTFHRWHTAKKSVIHFPIILTF